MLGCLRFQAQPSQVQRRVTMQVKSVARSDSEATDECDR
jgi:hypothetical protein